jgi:IS5 family transposase
MASHGRGNHMWPNNAFGLSHDGIEDAIYDSPADRAFAGKDPGREKGPDVSTASGLVHTVVGTIGEVSDVTQAHALLSGDENAALGKAGYQGVQKRPEHIGKSGDFFMTHAASAARG